MPLIENSTFKAPLLFQNNHVQTIYPSLMRTVEGVEYSRERLELPDNDFLDIDWSKVGSKKLLIALHGLEGNADRPYIKAQIKLFNSLGWDGLGINFRGCSGEINRKLKTYHTGETNDLRFVVDRILKSGEYQEIVLIGFSLGGNVVLKYLGEEGEELSEKIKKAVVFSVPCELASASVKLAKWNNAIYMSRFMKSLKDKIRQKEHLINGKIKLNEVYQARTFEQFDNAFTAPVNGFRDAHDYWKQAASKPYLENIQIPFLLINAADDSFLSKECYPVTEAKKSDLFHLEVPEKGGHVGFVSPDNEGYYWSERRVKEFVLGA